MKTPTSSRKRYRVLFFLWCGLGAVMAMAAYSPAAGKLNKNRQALEYLAQAREAAEQARALDSDENTRKELFKSAANLASASANLLGVENAPAAVTAEVELALIDLDNGRAFAALENLVTLASKDRPNTDSEWTANTRMIESALAETRYKIALMCRQEGDGFENWSKYAEASARGYQALADEAKTEDEKKVHLTNLAVCTRLIHGGDEDSHSLGFPACWTVDCAKKARVHERTRPNGGGGRGKNKSDPKNDEPWETPPEPNEGTIGK